MTKIIYQNIPKFTGRNVPINEIAESVGKSADFLRSALKLGVMHFGYAMKKEDSSTYSFYCPDKLVWEELGYFKEKDEVDF